MWIFRAFFEPKTGHNFDMNMKITRENEQLLRDFGVAARLVGELGTPQAYVLSRTRVKPNELIQRGRICCFQSQTIT